VAELGLQVADGGLCGLQRLLCPLTGGTLLPQHRLGGSKLTGRTPIRYGPGHYNAFSAFLARIHRDNRHLSVANEAVTSLTGRLWGLAIRRGRGFPEPGKRMAYLRFSALNRVRPRIVVGILGSPSANAEQSLICHSLHPCREELLPCHDCRVQGVFGLSREAGRSAMDIATKKTPYMYLSN
jgi:hypothetical protein